MATHQNVIIKPYEIAVSFAGEDREFVEQVVVALVRSGIKVFYDRFEQHDLLGRDLGCFLDQIYQHSAQFVAIFISKSYVEKAWTKHEFSSALAAKIFGREDYILPILLDNIILDGLPPTIGYISGQGVDPEFIAEILKKKISVSKITNEFAGQNFSSDGIAIYLENCISVSWEFREKRTGFEIGYLVTTSKNLLILAGKAEKRIRFFDKEEPGMLMRYVLVYNFTTRQSEVFRIRFPDAFKCNNGSEHDRWPQECVREISSWVPYEKDKKLPFRIKDIMPTVYKNGKWWNLSQQLTISSNKEVTVVQHSKFGTSRIMTNPDTEFNNFHDFAITLDGLQFAALYTGSYFSGDFEDPAYQDVGLAIFSIRALSGK